MSVREDGAGKQRAGNPSNSVDEYLARSFLGICSDDGDEQSIGDWGELESGVTTGTGSSDCNGAIALRAQSRPKTTGRARER